MKDDCTTNSHYPSYKFLSKKLGECTFELGSERVQNNVQPLFRPEGVQCTCSNRKRAETTTNLHHESSRHDPNEDRITENAGEDIPLAVDLAGVDLIE